MKFVVISVMKGVVSSTIWFSSQRIQFRGGGGGKGLILNVCYVTTQIVGVGKLSTVGWERWDMVSAILCRYNFWCEGLNEKKNRCFCLCNFLVILLGAPCASRTWCVVVMLRVSVHFMNNFEYDPTFHHCITETFCLNYNNNHVRYLLHDTLLINMI